MALFAVLSMGQGKPLLLFSSLPSHSNAKNHDRYGFSSLPKKWLKAMPHKTWLDKKIVAFLKLLHFIDDQGCAIPAEQQPQQSSTEADSKKDEKEKGKEDSI